jgi:hypothetical protein
MVDPLMTPVTGSLGAVPETKTSPAAFTAWLYTGGGLPAFRHENDLTDHAGSFDR